MNHDEPTGRPVSDHAGLRHPIDPDYLQTLSQRDYASRFERFRLRLR